MRKALPVLAFALALCFGGGCASGPVVKVIGRIEGNTFVLKNEEPFNLGKVKLSGEIFAEGRWIGFKDRLGIWTTEEEFKVSFDGKIRAVDVWGKCHCGKIRLQWNDGGLFPDRTPIVVYYDMNNHLQIR